MIPIAKRNAILIALVVAVALATAVVPPAAAEPTHGPDQGTIKIHDEEDADPDQRNEPHVTCDFWVEGFNMEGETGFLVFFSWPPTGDKSEVTPGGDDLDWTGEEEDDENGNFHFLNGAYFLPAGHYRVEAYSDTENDPHFEKSKTFWVDPCVEPCPEVDTQTVDECCPPQVLTLEDPCEPPERPECPKDIDMTATAESDGDILLEWDVDGTFNLYRAEGDGDFEYVDTVDGTSFTDTDTDVGVTYTYVITVFDEESQSESEPCARAQATAVPFFPSLAIGALALMGAVGTYAVMRRRS